MRKGIFIPDITVEMFRNASLEAVEELLVSGTMEDIEITDRPHGEWIWKKWVNFNLSGDIICSECNFVYFEGASKERMKAKLYPFCPNCGADMRKEGDKNE